MFGFTMFRSVFFGPVVEVMVVSAEIWHLRFSATIVFSSSSYHEKTWNLRFSIIIVYNTEVQTGFNKLYGFLNFQTGCCSPSVSWVVSAPHWNVSSFSRLYVVMECVCLSDYVCWCFFYCVSWVVSPPYWNINTFFDSYVLYKMCLSV